MFKYSEYKKTMEKPEDLVNLLKSISKDYNLNTDELLTKYCENKKPEESSTLKVNKYKCHALTKKGIQCSRNKFNNYNFCQNHERLNKANKLSMGTIDNPVNVKPETANVDEILENKIETETQLERIVINNKTYYKDIQRGSFYERGHDNSAIKINISV